ncbi:receptor kinase-like protein Xa21 [Gossypium raimondii]|uniref:receptor kinase-like protein Xa21 n=1 Tax=Gossypium raimondii TaxID=29730 RepID=UPI00227AC929|nr:receptor kinase-like protein Xa21 [Gossypium raimondii]
MPNGSLQKWLYSDDHALDILQRINIMVDVASALEYLHSGFLIPIIHCDLKPSNVLLDEDMVGHVGDFGVSKILGEGDSIKQTMTLATVGYMSPDDVFISKYGLAGIVSVKCDVYSYGILLMETFTRKKPTNEFFVGEMSMKHWVKMSLSNGINGVGDSSIVQEEDEYFVIKANCISSIMELALNCSAELPENRMDMKNDVIFGITKPPNYCFPTSPGIGMGETLVLYRQMVEAYAEEETTIAEEYLKDNEYPVRMQTQSQPAYEFPVPRLTYCLEMLGSSSHYQQPVSSIMDEFFNFVPQYSTPTDQTFGSFDFSTYFSTPKVRRWMMKMQVQ